MISAPKMIPQDSNKKSNNTVFKDRSKPEDVCLSNISACKAVVDAIRTSLGPKGMDKMIQEPKGDVTITNDGATILQQMKLLHPAAKMMVELSKAQDAEAGDGTTSVVVIAGALLDAAKTLLSKGLHPTTISEAFQSCAANCCQYLQDMSHQVSLGDKSALVKFANTALNSKVVHVYSQLLSNIAVETISSIAELNVDKNVNLKDIRVIKKLGGVVEESEIVPGLLLEQKNSSFGAPTTVEKAKIGLIQFCISAPKTDMDNQVVVSDYSAMDRILREERQYLLNIVKQIKKTGCNVLLVQKSILRDGVSDLAHHFLAKMKILVCKDVEREDIEFITKTLAIRPVASLDHFTSDVLASADLVQEMKVGADKVLRVTGIHNAGRTCTVVLRGSNQLLLDEAERSLHDALCVLRCLLKNGAMVAGGGAPEMQMSLQLTKASHGVSDGAFAYCFRAYARALDIIPYTLAENAGLNPIQTVTDLRNMHASGQTNAGINVRRGHVTNMLEENVLQPLLVSSSAITLATETVSSILKIDDIINVVN